MAGTTPSEWGRAGKEQGGPLAHELAKVRQRPDERAWTLWRDQAAVLAAELLAEDEES